MKLKKINNKKFIKKFKQVLLEFLTNISATITTTNLIVHYKVDSSWKLILNEKVNTFSFHH